MPPAPGSDAPPTNCHAWPAFLIAAVVAPPKRHSSKMTVLEKSVLRTLPRTWTLPLTKLTFEDRWWIAFLRCSRSAELVACR
jgi:hypothetical protein